MSTSSEDDVESEIFDLSALWNAPAFINDPDIEEPVDTPQQTSENESSPRIIELVPIESLPSVESEDSIEYLMNLMRRRAIEATNDREQILDLETSSGMNESSVASTSYPRVRLFGLPENGSPIGSSQLLWNRSVQTRLTIHEEESERNILRDEEYVSHRFRQIRHLVAGANNPLGPPRLPRGRQSCAYQPRGIGRGVTFQPITLEESESSLGSAITEEHNFILPRALRERELRWEIEASARRRDRSIFVSNLLFSSLTKHEDPPQARSTPSKKSPSKEETTDKIASKNNDDGKLVDAATEQEPGTSGVSGEDTNVQASPPAE